MSLNWREALLVGLVIINLLFIIYLKYKMYKIRRGDTRWEWICREMGINPKSELTQTAAELWINLKLAALGGQANLVRQYIKEVNSHNPTSNKLPPVPIGLLDSLLTEIEDWSGYARAKGLSVRVPGC